MLVVSRRLGERLVIGTGPTRVVVTVTDIDRGKIRLGITCDRSIPIVREELLGRDPLPRADDPLEDVT